MKILGVAALAPASNMLKIMTLHGADASGDRLAPYLATACSEYYPDVAFDGMVRADARDTAHTTADLCQFDPRDIAQGLADVVVYPTVHDTDVQERCAAGQILTYWRVPGRDHGGIVAPDSPVAASLAAWTRGSLRGQARPTGCQQSTIP